MDPKGRLMRAVDGSEMLQKPVEVGSLSHEITRLYTSQVVQDVFHQQ